MKNSWKPEDVAKLRVDYAAGKRIKTIASELGRTASAVNKTLTRLSIMRRSPRRVFSAKKYISLVPYYDKQKEDITKISNTQKAVSFVTVAKYLQSKGFTISKFSDPIIENCYKNEEEVFKVGNIPMTKMKVLLLANKIRLEEKEPIFSSKDITWF